MFALRIQKRHSHSWFAEPVRKQHINVEHEVADVNASLPIREEDDMVENVMVCISSSSVSMHALISLVDIINTK